MGSTLQYDDKGRLIYADYRSNGGEECRWKYDEWGNCIYYGTTTPFESWSEYDEQRNEIHYRDTCGREYWYKIEHYNGYAVKEPITKEEFDKIKGVLEHKEFLSRGKISRFELMDID